MLRRAGRLVLCAAVLGTVLPARPALSGTRAWWAHVPLDSLRPVLPPDVVQVRQRTARGPDSLSRVGLLEVLGIGPQLHAPLRLSAHVAWHGAGGDSGAGRAPSPGPLAPDRVRSGRMVWHPAPGPEPIRYACGVPEWEEVRGDSAVFDSVVFWRHMAECTECPVGVRRQVARLALADGDTVAADSILASPVLARSVWAWPVLRQRADLTLARGDTAGADSLLESADRGGWPDGERAAWLALRVRLRTDLGDTTRAIEFARQGLRVYPSLPATGQALALLEVLLRARGDSLSAGEQRAAAEVEVFGGRSAVAIRRLQRVVADPASGAERWRAGLRLCEVLRGARRFLQARAAAESLLLAPIPADLRARLWTEKARAELGAGRPDSALAIYSRLAGDDSLAPAMSWEAGRTAEDAGRWEESLRWYERVPRGARHGPAAALRAGLLHLALGQPDSATACWVPDTSDAARFWQGVARRASGDTAAGDSLLRRVAAQPGYSFYRAAARDTLGLRGWSGGIAAGACLSDSLCGPLREARDLIRLGLVDDAALLLSRWVAGDQRLARGSEEPLALEWLAAAHQAYAIGRVGLGIAWSERALEADAGLDRRQQWDLVPWAFPPAFESLFASPRDTVVASLEPALLFALIRQESAFDPRARSRSDALGLMQLKLGTAADLARLAHDPAPTEATLFDPERNVRYGARYLARLLRRFDGSVAAALSAYNAGAGSLSPRWREVRDRGGEALLCELASNPLAQDYAKRIVGFRQAYRELRPTIGAP